ncbi:pilus biogenesis lipoprotein CpaD [Tistlia consotensis]|uniref:Pilus biogenesis lipoprotein CpaD n=1 Tax=Tistlia consotensis USBA 355 TaxID=560819 RepID=A0A1Y6BI66_9PROT|nr:CpaD family pilus assembly lipoprotein [Tistlia consotensis]SMF12560.1 pilus biogenesis lipoprotein CpaD [Tistlia consotensis USBA 355]SNR50996.1 pilus biogenesis lipoprotein CpaD [Tistlia consotensis]
MKPLALGLLVLPLLAACASDIRPPSEARRPVAQPLVSLHAVAFAPDSAALSPAEEQDLARFVAAVDPQPGDPLLVELPAGSRAGGLAARRASAVGASLAALGLPSRSVALPEAGGDRVRVAVETVAVHAPEGCPDWQQLGTLESFDNGVSGNFGCATARNFAAMLDRPRDALEGRATGPAPAARMTVGVALYDAGAPIPLLSDGSASGSSGGSASGGSGSSGSGSSGSN